MKKILTLIVVIIFTISAHLLQAQHLFSVSYNELSNENVTNLKSQIPNPKSQIPNLSLTKNNEDRNVYAIPLSSVQNTKIILLNEDNEKHVVITPSEETSAEFQLEPFFMEELRQGILGDAKHYLVIESSDDFSVKNMASVEVLNGNAIIPQCFYGKKEDVKEALPQDRQITNIFKEKPILILADPNDPEMQRYAAQWEEDMSYYVYMYQFPDGMLYICDEHFICDNTQADRSGDYYNLPFNLTNSPQTPPTDEQREATEYALELWGEQLGGRVTVDINVDIKPMASGVLGSSSRMPQYFNPENNTWYCSAVGNQLTGINNTPNQKDIRIEMNSNTNFYYGVNGKTPNNRYDYLTIMLHEVSHGLGFFAICGQNGVYSYTTPNGGQGTTDWPGAYDRQLFEGLNGKCLVECNVSERKALVLSDNLYLGAPGSHVLQANGGERIKVFCPTVWSSGSSISHWDHSVDFPTFMKPSIGSGAANALHTFNDRKIGLMFDIGWTPPIPNPNAYIVTFMDNCDKGNEMTQQFLPDVTKKVKPNAFKNSGYTFSNWNTLPDGTGNKCEERESITPTGNMVLYAQWQANTYTLYFYPGPGATVKPTSKQIVFNTPIEEMPIPEREGYTFWGWTIDDNNINKETIWTYPSDKTARATWSPVGIEEIQNTALLQIVPNPANHAIELRTASLDLQVENIEFYNNLGQLVKTVPFERVNIKDEKTVQNIDISDLSAGAYIVKAGNNAAKLIVQ